jgi:hypothetical protein
MSNHLERFVMKGLHAQQAGDKIIKETIAMTTRHTPGPWTASKKNGFVLDADGAYVCDMRPAYREYARLIAQAPAMAEVINELLLVVEDFMPNVGRCALQNYQRLNEAPIKARALLAAIHGKE